MFRSLTSTNPLEQIQRIQHRILLATQQMLWMCLGSFMVPSPFWIQVHTTMRSRIEDPHVIDQQWIPVSIQQAKTHWVRNSAPEVSANPKTRLCHIGLVLVSIPEQACISPFFSWCIAVVVDRSVV